MTVFSNPWDSDSNVSIPYYDPANGPLTQEQLQQLSEKLGISSDQIDNWINSNWTLDINAKSYTPYADTPNLPRPDPNPQSPPPIPTPLNADRQQVVDQYYDQAFASGIANLIQSQQPPFTADEVTLLNQIATTGQIPDPLPGPNSTALSQALTSLQNSITAQTQQAFSLPATWTRTSTSAEDWTPLSLDNAPSITTSNLLVGQISSNSDQIFDDLITTINNLQANLNPNDPNSLALADYLKSISSAIQELKKQVRELQLIDAQLNQKANTAKFGEIQDRRDAEKAMEAKYAEMRAKQEEMKKTALAMKIVGPIVAALATIAGIIISVATLGIGTPAGIALIAVGVTLGVAMTTYAIVDSLTDTTQKLITAFNKWTDSLTPVPPHSQLDRDKIKFTIVAVIAAAAIAIIIASMLTGAGEGLAANAATQAAVQTTKQTIIELVKQLTIQEVKQAIAEVVKQLVLQFLAIFVLGTDALPQLVADAIKQSGGDEKTQQIARYITMAVEMAALILAMAKGGGGIKNAGQAVRNIGTSVKSGAAAIAETIGNVVSRTAKENAQIVAQQILEAIQTLLKQIQQLLKSLTKLPTSALNDIKASIDLVRNDLKGGTFKLLLGLAEAGPHIADAVGSAIQGKLLLDISKILREQGEIQAAEDLLQTLITLLEKTIANIQTAISNNQEFTDTLNQMFMNLYNAADQSVGGLAQAVRGNNAA